MENAKAAAGTRRRRKTMMWVLILVGFLIFLDLASSAMAITCLDITGSFQPCIGVLNGTSPLSSTSCCDGLKQILNFERQLGVPTACNCTMAILTTTPGLILNFDIQTPCNVSLGFTLNTTTSC